MREFFKANQGILNFGHGKHLWVQHNLVIRQVLKTRNIEDAKLRKPDNKLQTDL